MIMKVLDISNGKVKKIDTDDKMWMEWFARNYHGAIGPLHELKDLIHQIDDENCVVLVAIEKNVEIEKDVSKMDINELLAYVGEKKAEANEIFRPIANAVHMRCVQLGRGVDDNN